MISETTNQFKLFDYYLTVGIGEMDTGIINYFNYFTHFKFRFNIKSSI